MDILEFPMYNSSNAGRLLGISSNRVRRWLRGYDYLYTAGPLEELRSGHKGPVIANIDKDRSSYASFLDLIDLLFVREFLKNGISLQKTRNALHEVEQLLGSKHFARESFFTDGKSIYLQVRSAADALLELLSDGQWVIAPIIKQLAHQIEFDKPSGLAQRWYPLGQNTPVVLDPLISFGRPTIVGKGIATANVYDFFEAENKKLSRVKKWMDLTTSEIKAAVYFEQRLNAA